MYPGNDGVRPIITNRVTERITIVIIFITAVPGRRFSFSVIQITIAVPVAIDYVANRKLAPPPPRFGYARFRRYVNLTGKTGRIINNLLRSATIIIIITIVSDSGSASVVRFTETVTGGKKNSRETIYACK